MKLKRGLMFLSYRYIDRYDLQLLVGKILNGIKPRLHKKLARLICQNAENFITFISLQVDDIFWQYMTDEKVKKLLMISINYLFGTNFRTFEDIMRSDIIVTDLHKIEVFKFIKIVDKFLIDFYTTELLPKMAENIIRKIYSNKFKRAKVYYDKKLSDLSFSILNNIDAVNTDVSFPPSHISRIDTLFKSSCHGDQFILKFNYDVLNDLKSAMHLSIPHYNIKLLFNCIKFMEIELKDNTKELLASLYIDIQKAKLKIITDKVPLTAHDINSGTEEDVVKYPDLYYNNIESFLVELRYYYDSNRYECYHNLSSFDA